MPDAEGKPTYEELQEELRSKEEALAKKNEELEFLGTDEGKEWYKENYLTSEGEPTPKPNKEEEVKPTEINVEEIEQNAVNKALAEQDKRQEVQRLISSTGASLEDVAKHLHETSYPNVAIEEITKQILADVGIAQFAVNSFQVAAEKKKLASSEWTGEVSSGYAPSAEKLHPVERELARTVGLDEKEVLAAGKDMEIIY
jgi:hypothetical protein